MPENGIKYLPKADLLTYEEIERLVRLMANLGISKIRLTGGEPFVRKDLMKLIRRIVATPGIDSVNITTNGVLTTPHLAELKSLGIQSVNLSLDTINEERFKLITRRDEFRNVMNTLDALIKHEIPTKINAVVMENKNIDDIIPMIELTKNHPVSVRFIEEMPFNGEGSHYPTLNWTHRRILDFIQSHYARVEKLTDPENSTSTNYHVPGYKGNFGIIAAFSRTFCGTCNRIRITAQGTIKTCLYDDGVLNIRDLMRNGITDSDFENTLTRVFTNRPKDGFEAERLRKDHTPVSESMSTIGG